MSEPSLDQLFDNLIKETQELKAKGKVKLPPKTKSTGPSIDRMEALKLRRVEDLSNLSQGILPGGWTTESLLMQVTEYDCENCSTKTTAMNPAVVYVVCAQVRNRNTKFLRPLKPGEFFYYRQVAGIPLHTESNKQKVPVCQHCCGTTDEIPH